MSIQDPKFGIRYFHSLIKDNYPFTFIRFSDGEIEILKNRYLKISNGLTIFKGNHLNNNFPKYDEKIFDPAIHQKLRNDLLDSAKYSENYFYKGIPTQHNNAIDDKNFMIALNNGSVSNLTFSDLLINSNYKYFRKKLLPQILLRKNIIIISNYRSKLDDVFKDAVHIKIPDNFFNNYEQTLNNTLDLLLNIPKNSIILSSASSLSNILAFKLFKLRKDVTFLDIGTSINDLLGLNSRSRMYHQVMFSKTIKEKILSLIYQFSTEYKIKW